MYMLFLLIRVIVYKESYFIYYLVILLKYFILCGVVWCVCNVIFYVGWEIRINCIIYLILM